MFGGRSSSKIFCIGRNKTGTTSIEQALKELGYRCGNQVKGEALLGDWKKRRFDRIVKLCKSADVFQDIPFSLPGTYEVLDREFPGSKFILTVRGSADEWYESLLRWHQKFLKTPGVPTAQDLKNATHSSKGWMWDAESSLYGIDEATLYDRKTYTSHYERYNRGIVDYFKDRPGDLLVLNVAQPGAKEALCRFVGREYDGGEMPHLNASA